jgi:hypothetical protein
MDEQQVVEAIDRARLSIGQYLEIMRLFRQTNVAHDQYFQRKYNGFYRVRQRPKEWYQVYYEYMESLKGRDVSFSETLRHLQRRLGRYEPSFSSKLVATHNPSLPIWDVHVLRNIGLRAPSYTSPSKYDDAEAAYLALQKWYADLLCSTDGALIVRKFDELVEASSAISDTKKADFVLWQTRT